MTERSAARKRLDKLWTQTQAEGTGEADPEIDRLACSVVSSVRYALVTQIMGKIDDGRRNLLALQAEADVEGAWDARSFASKVVAPWSLENEGILGNSADPYVSKPLRRPVLETGMKGVRNKRDWDLLVSFLDGLNSAGRNELTDALQRVLDSLARRRSLRQVEYRIPDRISSRQLEALTDEFLGERSGGVRAMAVAVSLFRVLERRVDGMSIQNVQGITVSDAATDMPGDIVYTGKDGSGTVIEVKDSELTLADLVSSSRKARKAFEDASNLLLAVRGVKKADRKKIGLQIEDAWKKGVDVSVIEIPILVKAVLAVLDSKARIEFIEQVGTELDKAQDFNSRSKWRDLLLELNLE